ARWFIFAIAVIVLVTFGIYWHREWRERRYDGQIRRAASRYQIDPALIKAVIWRESRFDARARGKAGEIGLMQVRDMAGFEWADHEKIKTFSEEQLYDPETNIMAGSWYLSKLMKRYRAADNPLPYGLADYNAGRSHVLR